MTRLEEVVVLVTSMHSEVLYLGDVQGGGSKELGEAVGHVGHRLLQG